MNLYLGFTKNKNRKFTEAYLVVLAQAKQPNKLTFQFLKVVLIELQKTLTQLLGVTMAAACTHFNFLLLNLGFWGWKVGSTFFFFFFLRML